MPATPQVTSGYVAVGPLRMYYEIRGQGRDLVLLHGGGATIETTFERILPQLSSHHRTIALEQQGHGRTADVERPFSFDQMADDTAAALAQLRVGHADVFGFGNGGNIALQLALRHPAAVRKLVLASTFVRADGLVPELRPSFDRPVDIAEIPAGLRDAYLEVAPRPHDLQRQATKLMALMAGWTDWSADDLRRIGAPVLVVAGDQDIVTPEHALDMMRGFRHGQLMILPGLHGAYIGEASTPATSSRTPLLAASIIDEFLAGAMPPQS
jgi:pimeloyl-ACP methyl ester carboxylesterase